MVVHGGFCGESKETLDDFDLFDLDKMIWLNAICKKAKGINDKKEGNYNSESSKKAFP